MQIITKTYKKYVKDENGNRIKENGVFKTQDIETEYRIDADFQPKKATEICNEFIVNYCKSKGKEAVKWLLDLMKTKIPDTDKNGEIIDRKITNLEIRKAFVKKYFPSLSAKEKETPKQDDIIADLEKFLDE